MSQPAVNLMDRLPPHSEEAEAGVLGCILLEPKGCMAECQERFGRAGSSVFYDLRHQHIYEAMEELEGGLDTITLQGKLRDRGQLDSVGGLGFLSGLPDSVPSAANLEYYLEMVWEGFVLRRMVSICTGAVEEVYRRGDVGGSGAQSAECLDRLEKELSGLCEQRSQRTEVAISELMAEVEEEIEQYVRGGPQLRGLTTGFEYLDKVLLGLAPADVFVLSGRPGSGKTSLAMQLVEHVAVDKKVPSAVFSLEMSGKSLASRLLFQRARADYQRYRSGYFENRDVPKLAAVSGEIRRAPLYIDETAGLNVLEFRTRLRRMVRQRGIRFCALDYLQLMAPTRFFNNREQEVAEMSRGIKSAAKELGIPILLLAQMNREIERQPNRRPTMADLRESGAVEQDADIVGMLYEPKVKEEEEGEDWSRKHRRVNLYIAKQRNGPTGDVKLVFKKESMRFESAYDAPSGAATAPEAGAKSGAQRTGTSGSHARPTSAGQEKKSKTPWRKEEEE